MTSDVTLQRADGEIRLTLKIKLQPGLPMLECEEQILLALDKAGRLVTAECLGQFDADGSPLVLGDLKLTSKGLVPKTYQTPYGELVLPRHVYQSSDGGATFCPLDEQARVIESTTPRFAKMCSFKYTALSSTQAQMDLEQNHGRKVSRCYLQDLAEAVGLIAQAKQPCWRYADPEFKEEVRTVAVGVDGVILLYCQEGWRQAMVGTISLYDGLGNRLHSIYLGAPPEYGKEEFYRQLEEEIQRYKVRYAGARWVGVADGAPDHWERLRGWTELDILDFWHAAGYLEKASQGVKSSPGARKEWFEQSRHRLKEEPGVAQKLLKEMRKALAQRPPKGGAGRDEMEDRRGGDGPAAAQSDADVRPVGTILGKDQSFRTLIGPAPISMTTQFSLASAYIKHRSNPSKRHRLGRGVQYGYHFFPIQLLS